MTSEINSINYKQLEVRTDAIKLALDSYCGDEVNAKKIVDVAITYEKYIWGRFAPNDKAPTPLSTIKEAAEATRDLLAELQRNSADEALQHRLATSLETWERFQADLEAALGPLYG